MPQAIVSLALPCLAPQGPRRSCSKLQPTRSCEYEQSIVCYERERSCHSPVCFPYHGAICFLYPRGDHSRNAHSVSLPLRSYLSDCSFMYTGNFLLMAFSMTFAVKSEQDGDLEEKGKHGERQYHWVAAHDRSLAHEGTNCRYRVPV